MQPGDIVGGRFEIELHAGSGGMGHVFRARDRRSGAAVALKVLSGASAQETSRFAREAQTLATLRVPGVVRYIAHGATALGQPYLAMEWLTGETLSQRLSKSALSIRQTVALGRRVAATLGAVHRLGIVHRDLKPSNLLLVDGAIEAVTLIDFGVVRLLGHERRTRADQQLTIPGSILGTPGYMAPEQARGQQEIDARADVFALGCVLYKCLTGRVAFQGAGEIAVLAKVILANPTPLGELRGGIPQPLEELVMRMLAKAPDQRPRDGMAVASELAAIDGGAGEETATRTQVAPPQQLTTGERKVMCIVLARYGATDDEVTRSETEEHERAQELGALAARYQAHLELIEAEAPLLALSGAGSPTDLAVRAARCALAVQALLGGVPVVLATGRAELAERLPIGELVDRAALLLAPRPGDGRPPIAIEARPRGVRIDHVTAGLLGARFETAQDGAGFVLLGAREEADAEPQLLGRPTACVGRERELALLVGELGRCIEERVSGAVLVTGAAGLGKSRLRHELLRTLREGGAPIEVWLGQADPISAGSAFSLISHALRRLLGILDGEPIEARRRKVLSRVTRHASLGAEAPRVAAFLGELVGAPFPDEDDVKLRAARRSMVLMSDQLRTAWEDFVQAECAAQPVLLVLEDLHWGDLPTVTLVEAALRQLAGLPFLVLALARPEVHDLFPSLWVGRIRQEIHLSPLRRRACDLLVRQALGDRASASIVDTLIARADGNAFFLEEQIRAVAEGRRDSLPETVLATVQARLETLDAQARRALRAASVFGETFWQDGVSALVGGASVELWLQELTQREVIVPQGRGRFQGELEYRFRHALVREAAYGMLTARDRQLGHALAGGWLERAGETDPMTLAEHFERGGDRARAAAFYQRAAEEALRGNDLGAAIQRADRGAACGPDAVTAGALRLVEAEARIWRGEFAIAEQRGIEALGRLIPGTAPWFAATARVVTAAARLGGFDRVERWTNAALATGPEAGAEVARGICLGMGALMLTLSGRYAAADALIASVDQGLDTYLTLGPELAAHLHQVRAFRARASGDPGACLASLAAALAAFEEAGDHRNACAARQNLGCLYNELGDHAGAEAVLRAALTAAKRMELADAMAFASHNLGPVLAHLGRLDEAAAAEDTAIAIFWRSGDTRSEGLSRIYLAQIMLLAGDLVPAEREARRAGQLLQRTLPLCAYASAVRARALLALAQTEQACAASSEAISLLETQGTEEGESLIRLVHAEALAAAGDEPAAAAAMQSARESLLARAASISDPGWRQRFLYDVPDNAQTLELARSWLDGRHL